MSLIIGCDSSPVIGGSPHPRNPTTQSVNKYLKSKHLTADQKSTILVKSTFSTEFECLWAVFVIDRLHPFQKYELDCQGAVGDSPVRDTSDIF